mgnify:CR=1 FL=1
MFNISLFLSLCSPSVRLRDYFSAPEGGKEQPDKAGRENTLDNGEEDFHAPAVCRHWQDCDGRILSQQNKSLKVAGLNGCNTW